MTGLNKAGDSETIRAWARLQALRWLKENNIETSETAAATALMSLEYALLPEDFEVSMASIRNSDSMKKMLALTQGNRLVATKLPTKLTKSLLALSVVGVIRLIWKSLLARRMLMALVKSKWGKVSVTIGKIFTGLSLIDIGTVLGILRHMAFTPADAMNILVLLVGMLSDRLNQNLSTCSSVIGTTLESISIYCI